MEEFNISQHFLVPEHIKLSVEEKQKLLETYNISTRQLPMINIEDPALKNMDANIGDVIKIKRHDKGKQETEYYRVVVSG